MATNNTDLADKTVIVFGAGGGVGGYAALEAAQLGAKVYLAMRDTSKPLSVITPEEEAAHNFTRIQADLTDPESVATAVTKSGATAAFTYSLYRRPRLTHTARAMAEAGITRVVLMSTYVIPSRYTSEDLRKIDQEKEMIAFLHAENEIDIENAGMKLTALRSGFFAGNPFVKTLNRNVSPPQAFYVKGTAKMDMIDPRDVGRVAGIVLAKGQSTTTTTTTTAGKEVLYLVGPKLYSYREMWETINRVFGKNIKMNELPKEKWVAIQKATGLRPIIAEQLGDDMEKFTYAPDELAASARNFQKYLGQPPAEFEDFLVRNRHLGADL